jgi:Fe2+ transport system protein FeoA
MRLSELKTGESATIVKVMGHGGFRRRIMEMGFVRGQRVEVILNAPLKDPIEYKIMGYDISLRRSEADMVVVLTDDEAGEYLARREHHRHHRHAHSGECGCPAAETAPAEIRTEARRNPTRRAARASTRSWRATPAPSPSRWWATPTAARPRFSTPYRAATSMWAITAA